VTGIFERLNRLTIFDLKKLTSSYSALRDNETTEYLRLYANDQSTSSTQSRRSTQDNQEPSLGAMPTKARRMLVGQNDDPKEA